MNTELKLPAGCEELLVAERHNYLIMVGNYPNGNPKNRITIRAIGNVDPSKDIVFDVHVRDNKIILEYPLFFKLEKMFKMLEFIRDYESEVIQIGKTIWKS